MHDAMAPYLGDYVGVTSFFISIELLTGFLLCMVPEVGRESLSVSLPFAVEKNKRPIEP